MSIYFGTDGIRGVVNKDFTNEVCYKCGNALASICPNAKILIGRDTRVSGSFVSLAFSTGCLIGGANVVDVGVIPTAGISYLVKKLNFDFGVVISASHNPPEHNGIKIFDKNGDKINSSLEDLIEKQFVKNNIVNAMYVGTYCQKTYLNRQYLKHLIKSGQSLKGVKVAIDCSNGASSNFAHKVFKALGANVYKINVKNDGRLINENCGALYPQMLSDVVVKQKCDMGFAFDGDSDRIIAVDEKGNIVNGDLILFVLAKYFGEKGKLKNNCVVGTTQTNMGLELALKNIGVKLFRSDVGDKYVVEKMKEVQAELGGEQSGHIIIQKYSNTGDGILAGVVLAGIVSKTKKSLSKLYETKLYPQTNINVEVIDKLRILNSQSLKIFVKECEKELKGGRIVLRASGTESKIRIMVEGENQTLVKSVAEKLEKMVKSIELNN